MPTAATAWTPVLAGRTAREALAVATEVGLRLRDQDRLATAIELARSQSRWPELGWEPVSLAEGHPGLALVFAQLDAVVPENDWGAAAHQQLVHSVEALKNTRPVGSGLYSGLAGVAFAVQAVDPGRYARLLESLDRLLVRHTQRLVTRLESRPHGAAERDFDVVSGLSGVGAYWLARGSESSLKLVLEPLVDLVLANGEPPRWTTPSELLDEEAARACPRGRANCGLAHGLPGPLALLALAHRAGVDVDGARDAVERAAAWLRDHAVEDEWGINWPYSVRPDAAAVAGARAAWCYGVPGVSRSLWLAGEVLGDDRLRDVAVASLEAVYRRPWKERRINAPSFCHGWAGLLQITIRMAADSGSATLRGAAADLAAQLTTRFDAEVILGYRDVEPDDRAVDQPGLLTGAAGIVLALLAAATSIEPRWDRMFLLA